MYQIFKSASFFLVLATAFLQGQIKGTVIDQKTNLPIEYATIILEQEEQILEGTVSAPNGSFLMPVSNSGTFSIKVSFLGYEPFIASDLKIKTNSPLDLGRIFLLPGQNFLDEIVLDAETNSFQNKIDRKVYAAGESPPEEAIMSHTTIRTHMGATVSLFAMQLFASLMLLVGTVACLTLPLAGAAASVLVPSPPAPMVKVSVGVTLPRPSSLCV